MLVTAIRKLLFVLLVGIVPCMAFANDGSEVTGSVLVLENGSENVLNTVNVGGLVIVEIMDAGSAPVEIKSVQCSEPLSKFGCVGGVRTADGKPLMGGGYTWCLFRPTVASASAKIEITYVLPPHVGGGTQTSIFEIEVTDD